MTQKWVLLQFWRLEVAHQGVGTATPPGKALGTMLPACAALGGGQRSLACRHIAAAFPPVRKPPSASVGVSVPPPLRTDFPPVGRGRR